ncbi:WD repeat-containing protein 55-like [Heterodontus francisci]|uniref:WD repeat-containing protein 55-like n=1 Tax=Heterodontus francisci TaxID=7792 RepID=UPI00355C8A2A
MAAPTAAENVQEHSGVCEAGQVAALTSEDSSEDKEEVKEPRVRETPEDITFDAIVNTIAFHPTRDIIAAGDVDGDVYVYVFHCRVIIQ